MSFEKMKKLKKWQFYLLSFTWGLPLSLMGLIVCFSLIFLGKKPTKYGHCYHISIGKNWGGFSMGWFFLNDKREIYTTLDHEVGHGYQNACLYGPITVVLTIISAIRYWLQRFGLKFDYYAYFFEKQASKIGDYIFDGGGKE